MQPEDPGADGPQGPAPSADSGCSEGGVWLLPGSTSAEAPSPPDGYGAKAASLARLGRAKLNVPPAFAVSAASLAEFDEGVEPARSDHQRALLEEGVAALEGSTGRSFGAASRPLLLAVRASPLEDHPGLLPTYLDVGATRSTLAALEGELGRRAALGVRRRWLATLGVALGVAGARVVGDVLRRARREQASRAGLSPLSTDYELERALPDAALDERTLEAMVQGLEELVPHPEADAHTSLLLAVRAVARASRDRLGAVRAGCVIQAMVFGNRDEQSGTGVATSRGPRGEPRVFLEIGRGAQGLDPDLRGAADGAFLDVLERLEAPMRRLEREERAPVDVEVVVESGQAWFVQHRRSALGGVALARATVSLSKEGVLSREEAVARVSPEHARDLFALHVADEAAATALARGLGASPGLVTGVLAVRLPRALSLAALGISVILARAAPSTEEVPAMRAVAGIVAAQGGLTCHAAVIARALRKPAVVGCAALECSERDGVLRVHSKGATVTLHEGSLVTVDGSTGAIFSGRPPIRIDPPAEEVVELFEWADAIRGVALASVAEDEATELLARQLGAALVSTDEASKLPACPTDASGWRHAQQRGDQVLCRVDDVPRARLAGAHALLQRRWGA